MSGEGRPRLPVVDAANLALAIAGTRWHPEITDSLVERATTAAKESGVEDLLVVRVAGAVELPVIAQELARHYDAVVCLGAVIRGGTPHFEYVCDAVTAGLTRVALDARTPVGNGVLTCNTRFRRPAIAAGCPTAARTRDGRQPWQRWTPRSCCARFAAVTCRTTRDINFATTVATVRSE